MFPSARSRPAKRVFSTRTTWSWAAGGSDSEVEENPRSVWGRQRVIAYREARGSDVIGVDRELIRSRWVIQLFLLWILAGWFSTRTAVLWIMQFKRANKMVEPIGVSRSALFR